MCTKSILQSMTERDPFLRSNLLDRKHQEELHKAYLQLSQSISDMLRPPTPESDESEKRKVRRKDGRRSRQQRTSSRRSARSSNASILDKYRIQPTPSARQPSRQSNRQGKKKKEKWKPKHDAPIMETARTTTSLMGEPRQTYSIRYSKVLDIFKRKMYRDIISRLGIHINCLEDPDLVEIDLAWCKVGTFILESRDNTSLSFAQFVEDTTSVVDGDLDDRLSMYSGFLPPIGARSGARMGPVISRSSSRSSDVPDRTRKSRSHASAEDSSNVRQSKVPKLPAIGEDSFHG